MRRKRRKAMKLVHPNYPGTDVASERTTSRWPSGRRSGRFGGSAALRRVWSRGRRGCGHVAWTQVRWSGAALRRYLRREAALNCARHTGTTGRFPTIGASLSPDGS